MTKKRDIADLHRELEKRSAEALLALYGELLGDDDPHLTAAPALVLRNKARAEQVDEGLIPLLAFALADAPNLAVFVHLCKALASFGRSAQMAAPMIIERLNNTPMNSDRRFWAWDGALHSLGFLGGEPAETFVAALKAQSPSPALRSKSVYRGDIKDEEREKIFQRTLRHITDRLADDNPRWLAKRTEMTFTEPKASAATGGLKPWMTR